MIYVTPSVVRGAQNEYVSPTYSPHTVQKAQLLRPRDDLLQVPKLDKPRPQFLKYGVSYSLLPLSTHAELIGDGMEADVYQLPNLQGHMSLSKHGVQKLNVLAAELESISSQRSMNVSWDILNFHYHSSLSQVPSTSSHQSKLTSSAHLS